MKSVVSQGERPAEAKVGPVEELKFQGGRERTCETQRCNDPKAQKGNRGVDLVFVAPLRLCGFASYYSYRPRQSLLVGSVN